MLLSSIVLLVSLFFLWSLGRVYRLILPQKEGLNFDPLAEGGICLICGLLIQHVCFLLFRSYGITNLILLILAVGNLFLLPPPFSSTFTLKGYFSKIFDKDSNQGSPKTLLPLFFQWSWRFFLQHWSLFLLLFILFFLAMMSPIQSWDARSSWFFQGHALAESQGLFPQPYWYDGLYWFPQWEYPKFFSSLVGNIVFLSSHWDNYFPKVTLGLIFVPIILLLASQWRERWSSLWLMVSIVGACHKSLWDGYMDAYVALYAGVSLLFWMRWWEERKLQYFYLSFASVSLLPLLKNEGMVLWGLLLSFYFLSYVAQLLTASEKPREKKRAFFRLILPWLLVPILSLLIWHYWKSEFHLKSWLLAKGTSSERFLKHWKEGWASGILDRLLIHSFIVRSWMVTGVAFLYAMWKRQHVYRDLMPIVVSLPYIGALWLALMLTPLEMDHQLSTTQHRIVYAVRIAAFISLFLITERLMLNRKEQKA